MTLDTRCAATTYAAAVAAAVARTGLSLTLDLAKLPPLLLLLLLLSLLRLRCPLQLLQLFILLCCPQQIILQRIEHIVEIEELGGAEKVLHILRLCCTTLALSAGALCQLIGGCILARCRYNISTITDLQRAKRERKAKFMG